jgi:hypothetical protein
VPQYPSDIVCAFCWQGLHPLLAPHRGAAPTAVGGRWSSSVRSEAQKCGRKLIGSYSSQVQSYTMQAEFSLYSYSTTYQPPSSSWQNVLTRSCRVILPVGRCLYMQSRPPGRKLSDNLRAAITLFGVDSTCRTVSGKLYKP